MSRRRRHECELPTHVVLARDLSSDRTIVTKFCSLIGEYAKFVDFDFVRFAFRSSGNGKSANRKGDAATW